MLRLPQVGSTAAVLALLLVAACVSDDPEADDHLRRRPQRAAASGSEHADRVAVLVLDTDLLPSDPAGPLCQGVASQL